MKKFALVLAIVLIFPALCLAAGSCTVKAGNRSALTAEIIWECTGDAADGTIPNTSAGSLSSLFYQYPYTLSLVVESLAADTNVTDNSDVYLRDKSSVGADLLDGYGVDQLDDSARNFIRLVPNPLPKQVWLDVDNQAVASGKYTVTLTITK